MSAKLITTVCG